jgi:hypothetical protein
MACLSWSASQSIHPQQQKVAVPCGRRRLVVAAAAQPAPRRTSGRGAVQRALVSALVQQARREVWGGWLSDLVVPLLSDDTGSPVPPPVTRPARELADDDSLFVDVDGVTLHYKQAWPAAAAASTAAKPDSQAPAAAPAAAAGAAGAGAAPAAAAAAERPLLLLVHGFNGSVFSWRTTMQEVADATGCRCGTRARRLPPCVVLYTASLGPLLHSPGGMSSMRVGKAASPGPSPSSLPLCLNL